MPYRAPTIPLSYTTPSFPALYWPIRAAPGVPQYLYSLTDIWRFTLYWTLLTYAAAYILVSAWAVLMQFRSAYMRSHNPALANRSPKDQTLLGGRGAIKETVSWVWMIPVVYLVVGGLEALLAGSLVGLVVGAVYNAGYFKMSTWMPFLWGLINVLVLILSSFRIQGGL